MATMFAASPNLRVVLTILKLFGKTIQDDRGLLTHDLDFGLIADRRIENPPAVVLMRLAPLRASVRADLVARFLRTVGESYRGNLYVLEPGSVSMRSLHPRE